MADQKLRKAVVLYYPPDQIGKSEGARCGICMMFDPEGYCSVVEGRISGKTGICGLYVYGKPHEQPMCGTTPKAIVGYAEVGPTHCGSCKHYEGDKESGSCQIVDGIVEFEGCCNSWEEEAETSREWRI